MRRAHVSRLAATALPAVLTTALATACGGATWQTYQSASCDVLVDFDQPPTFTRQEHDTKIPALGDVHTIAAGHRVVATPARGWFLSCFTLPSKVVSGVAAKAILDDLAITETEGLDDWQGAPASPPDPAPDDARRFTLTHKHAADIHGQMKLFYVPDRLRTYTILALDPPSTAAGDAFVASVHPAPALTLATHLASATASDAPPEVVVRSAECHSLAAMPGWPHGTFEAGVATHAFEADGLSYQLRCIFLAPERAAAGVDAIFADVRLATVRDTDFTLRDERRFVLDGHPTRDFDLVSSDGLHLMEARVAWDGTRIQAVTLAGPATPAGQAAARRFLASFRLFGRGPTAPSAARAAEPAAPAK